MGLMYGKTSRVIPLLHLSLSLVSPLQSFDDKTVSVAFTKTNIKHSKKTTKRRDFLL